VVHSRNMGKGDRANLEKLLRSAWERQVRLEAISGKHMPNRTKSSALSTEVFIGLVLAIGALMFAALTMELGYSFWQKVLFVVLGAACLWLCAWHWEKLTKWPKSTKVLISCICSILFFVIMEPPLVSQFNKQFDIKLDFKDSPGLTQWKKIIIRYDLSRFRDYLVQCGITPPSEIAPLEVSRTRALGIATPPQEPYKWAVTIPEKQADRRTITYAYLIGVFSARVNGFPGNLSQLMGFLQTKSIVEPYINSSYWDTRDNHNHFWLLRGHFERQFVDRLAVRAFVIASSEPPLNSGTMAFFCNALKEADTSIDSDSAKWPEIAKTLEMHEDCN
jgi:hypothetical protein